MTTPDQDLLDTIEEIRMQEFPEVPAELVKQIVLIERDFTENRHEAYKRISQAMDIHLATTVVKKTER